MVGQKRIYLISNDGEKYSCNPRAIFEYLYKNHKDEFDFVYIVNNNHLKSLLPRDVKTAKQGTLKEMIGYLKETNIINSDDTLMIREILNYRNRIVHSSIEDDKPSLEYTRQLLKKTNEIIQKLKKII